MAALRSFVSAPEVVFCQGIFPARAVAHAIVHELFIAIHLVRVYARRAAAGAWFARRAIQGRKPAGLELARVRVRAICLVARGARRRASTAVAAVAALLIFIVKARVDAVLRRDALRAVAVAYSIPGSPENDERYDKR